MLRSLVGSEMCIRDSYNGLYDKALEEIDKVKEDAAAVVDYLHKIGFCLKELRYYDEALELLLIDSEEVKVNIACCFILRGEIEKGIKLFGSLTKLNVENLIEIGRALYDVRWYAKSKEYFLQYFTKAEAERSWNPNHCTLDGFCKVLILNNKFSKSKSNLAHQFYQVKDNEAMSFQLRFRWSMFAVCCSIREDRMTESIKACLLYTSPSPRDS